MAGKDLRRYSRIDLLEMLLRLQRRINPGAASIRRLEKEIRRLRYRRRFLRVLAGITAALVLMLVLAMGAAWRLPVLRITDASMGDGMPSGAYVVAARDLPVRRGDLIAFQREGMLLVRRMIAAGGDEVQLDGDGTVFVNGSELPEGYIPKISAGTSEISYPYLVPLNHVFVLGDNRLESVDSRHQAVGVVHEDEILGRVWLQILPLNRIELY